MNAAHRFNLLVPGTPLFGREREIERVLKMLAREEVPMVTLVGPGGIGKTRLALAVAHVAQDRFRDGAVFVPLAPVRDPALVPREIAVALGLEDQQRDALELIAHVLAEREMLLVLDNLEHLLEAGRTVGALLRAARGLTILTTSRAPLRISGEHEYPLGGLDLPEPDASLERVRTSSAVRLFEARAQVVSPDFTVEDANASTIAQIVRKLDGLPLVLELAAARTRLFSPEELLLRLARPLSLLAGGPRDLPARQQTIRTTIDWSFDLLPPLAQRFFARLGAFVGGFDLESAQAVAGESQTDALETLAALLESSLVQRAATDNRYRLLEPVREYALEKLEASGELEAIRARHAAQFFAFVERARPEHWTEDHNRLLHEFDRELPNIRAAFSTYLERDQGDQAALMGWSLWNFWWTRGYSAEGKAAMERTLESATLSEHGRARAHFVRYSMIYMGGEYLSLNQYATEIIDAFRRVNDRWGEGISLFGMGLVRTLAGHHDEAERAFAQSLEVFRAIDNRRSEGTGLYGLGLVAYLRGDLNLARERLENGKNTSLLANDRGFYLSSAIVLIFIELAIGTPERVEALLNESVDLALEIIERPFFAASLEVWAILAVRRGDHVRAARLFGAASALRAAIGVPLLIAFRSQLDQAILLAQQALGPRFEAHHTAGRAMGFEAALGYARGAADPTGVEPVPSRDPLTDLTPREREVLRLVAQGLSDKRIAGELGIGPETAKTHVRSILSKLNLPNRVAATRHALEHGLV